MSLAVTRPPALCRKRGRRYALIAACCLACVAPLRARNGEGDADIDEWADAAPLWLDVDLQHGGVPPDVEPQPVPAPQPQTVPPQPEPDLQEADGLFNRGVDPDHTEWDGILEHDGVPPDVAPQPETTPPQPESDLHEADGLFDRGMNADHTEWDDVQEHGGAPQYVAPEPGPVREPELDPRWREAARERIDKHRKADLVVRVVNGSGEAVPDAEVAVRMRRHEFGFGSAVAARFLVGDEADGVWYRRTVKKLFNKVTIESDLKWPHWEDLENRKLALEALGWLRRNGFPVRGHCLIWAGWSWMPDDIYDLKDNPKALRRRAFEHVVEEVSALRGQLVEWDVVNEPDWYDVLMEILGREVMIDWYKLVHRLDPQAVLYINEYGILPGDDSYSRSKRDTYAENIRWLLDNGAPVQGIGLQGHFSWSLSSPSSILKTIDRFAEFGKPIQITEFDIDISDEQRQAEYMRDFMTTVFSHPAVNAVIMWGFWEGRHWRPRGALYRLDWSLKPCGEVWRDLVFKEWWTEAEGRTDADGVFKLRGFRGEYEIEARSGDRAKRMPVSLPAGGQVLTVRLD